MSSPVDEIRAEYAARYGAPRTELIEAGRVRDYLLALNEPIGVDEELAVPALFLLTLGRTRRPMPSRGAAVNAGDEFEFLARVCVGDAITITKRVLGVDEKEGKKGKMYLVRTEATYVNQHGTRVARATQSTLRWGW